jgi:DNA-binding response OmpR family regulator
MKVAVVTKNENLYRSICQCFIGELVSCRCLNDEDMIARAMHRQEFDVVLLDASTEISAVHPLVARRGCYAMRATPLIVVGAHDERASINRALQVGAHDIVFEPVVRRELLMRVQIARQRAQLGTKADERLEYGAYVLDKGNGVVYRDGHRILLTTREFAIAWLLFSHAGEYVSRRQIANTIWGGDESIVGRTLEQHIYKLRKKLDLNKEGGICLQTMYAYGYRIERADAPDAEAERMLTRGEPPVRSLPEQGSRMHDGRPAAGVAEPVGNAQRHDPLWMCGGCKIAAKMQYAYFTSLTDAMFESESVVMAN